MDGGLEFGNAAEDAAAYSLASDLGEQTLNQIEPGRGCRGEVQLEARMALEPTLHGRRLVCGVIVEDQVEVETRQRLFVDPPEEFQEFLGTMARETFTNDLASRNVEGGEQRGIRSACPCPLSPNTTTFELRRTNAKAYRAEHKRVRPSTWTGPVSAS
jgi:hypothetical protein